MASRIGGLAFLVALAFAGKALAAPFCVVASFGTQCYYYDAESCQRAAASARGACVINQEEAQQRPATPVGAPFCVYASYGTQCYYYDAPSCQRAAEAARGACVVNPNR